MRSVLEITTPAEDLQFLTIEEMRLAADIAANDDSQDDALESRGLAVAAGIVSECNVAVGNGAEPTLLKETLTETFYSVDRSILVLSRRHNVEVSSIVSDGAAIEAESYTVEAEAGIVRLIGEPQYRRWRASKIVVVYDAGFEEIPAGLKQEALDRFTSITTESSRDPYVKGETIDVPGIESRRVDYWAGALPGSSGGTTTFSQSDALKRFRNSVLA